MYINIPYSNVLHGSPMKRNQINEVAVMLRIRDKAIEKEEEKGTE